MFENKWVVFLLRAGVYFPRGNTGSPFFSSSLYFSRFPSAQFVSLIISPRFNQIRWTHTPLNAIMISNPLIHANNTEFGGILFICLRHMSKNTTRTISMMRSVSGCFFVLKYIYKGGHIYVKRKISR